MLEKLLYIYKIVEPLLLALAPFNESKHFGRMYQFHLQFQQEIMETFPSHRA